MQKIIFGTAIIIAVSIVPAAADYIDDQIAKAERSVANAEKRLAKWQACAEDREACLAELSAKAAASADRAQKKLEAINASVVVE